MAAPNTYGSPQRDTMHRAVADVIDRNRQSAGTATGDGKDGSPALGAKKAPFSLDRRFRLCSLSRCHRALVFLLTFLASPFGAFFLFLASCSACLRFSAFSDEMTVVALRNPAAGDPLSATHGESRQNRVAGCNLSS
eukprot:3591353-Pleurochrysis_carterae.AAC.1